MSNHKEWLDQVTNSSSNREVSKLSGVPMRTIYNQLEKGSLSPENVIAIAVAYGHHPVGALVDTGYLDEKWATQVDPAHALRTVTEDQLADEVLRRMNIGKAHGALDVPVDELTERRAKKSNTSPKPVSPVWDGVGMPPDAVADDSEEVGGTLDDLDP